MTASSGGNWQLVAGRRLLVALLWSSANVPVATIEFSACMGKNKTTGSGKERGK